jgi:hypothetical protein
VFEGSLIFCKVNPRTVRVQRAAVCVTTAMVAVVAVVTAGRPVARVGALAGLGATAAGPSERQDPRHHGRPCGHGGRPQTDCGRPTLTQAARDLGGGMVHERAVVRECRARRPYGSSPMALSPVAVGGVAYWVATVALG